MTLTQEGADAPPVPEGYVRLTIDDRVVDAPKGELIIRTCERLGIIVPRFCDHPLLDPAGACRQCLVEVEMGGRPMPKPQASCTMTVADGMVVRTQHTSKVADKAQQGVMELLLINHPLDCPICDKGGECPLQNQAMSSGRTESRFVDTKRTFPKPIPISTEVLLDRERCVLCQRCTRFSEQIAGDPFIELLERGAQQQIGVAEDKPFQSYFSGNTIQICPVGALTSAAYRFRSRPFDLVSTPTRVRALRVRQRDAHRHPPRRRAAAAGGQRPRGQRGVDRRQEPVRASATSPRPTGSPGRWSASPTARWPRRRGPRRCRSPRGACWPRARAASACSRAGGSPSRTPTPTRKFARVAAGTNDVDFRARPHSAEELEFLAAHVVGQGPEALDYTRLEAASTVLCVALEPEEEAPIVYLRLRKAVRKHGQNVYHLGQWTTPAVERTSPSTGAAAPPAKDNLIPVVPGAEAAVLGDLPEAVLIGLARGGVVLVGERAAEVPGLYSAVSALAAAHGRGGRLGAAPRGRAGRARRGRRAHPAARRPVGRRRRRPRRGRGGLGPHRRARCPRRRAATPTPSSPRRGWASWPRSWSAGSTRTTWPIRRPRSRACARSGSW